jgi:MHS family proline/betaine transporter-like MFS transporter
MSAKKRRFVFVSAISGNILEYYDFTVYTIFSMVLGKVFFPQASEFVQTLSSLAVFAVGFVTRPIGGIVFGYIGDRYGRRISLICSMFGMTFTTFAMGFLPEYNSLGVIAPILLVILRLIQGLCISGEGAGAAIFVLEHVGKLRPGLVTGLVNGSNITGTLLASLVGILLNLYCDSTDAWRYAFILGGVMGIFGGYLRLKTSETPIFQMLSKKKQLLKSPFLAVVKDSWHFMVLTCCVGGFASSVVYIVKAYVNVFYTDIMHLGSSVSLMYVSYTSFILMVCMPIAGAISDYIGRARILKIAAVMLFIFTAPIMNFMGSENSTYQILAITGLGILGGAMAGGAYIFVISLFEPRERFSGVSFSYNLGVAIFGGTAPMISRWLVEKTAITYSPAFYLMFVSAIFLLAMQIMDKHIKSKMKT